MTKVWTREVTKISILKGFDQKKHFFEGWSWLKFINLELILIMALKFYTVMAKGSFPSTPPPMRLSPDPE